KRAVKDYVLVLKDNTRPNRNLKVAYSDNPLGPYKNVSETFSPKLTEGPTVIKKDGKYLIYYDAYGDKKYTTLSTIDFKKFEDISSLTTIPEGHKHGTVIRVKKKIIEDLKK
ncbi:MAG: arabinosidase, partial [Pedobacter sp.]